MRFQSRGLKPLIGQRSTLHSATLAAGVNGARVVSGVKARPSLTEAPFVFPPDWGDGHFVGIVRVLDRICAKAELGDVTPHVLRHTFASIAGDLGFSELTIAGLLGHSARGVTQGYVHLDSALIVAANQVAAEIARLLDGDTAAARRARRAVRQARSKNAA